MCIYLFRRAALLALLVIFCTSGSFSCPCRRNEFPVDNVYKSHLPRLILQYIEKILHIEHIGLEELASIVAAVEALVRSSVEEKLGLGSAPHPGRAYLRLSAALDVAGVSVAKLFPMGRFAVAVLLGRPMGKENGLLP
mmetsp:Transcript_163429/g.524044  ORF Transcript_163429/g.524044 Transcript_163429/m.524044 type:complete len:138 (-) Transcript_163429:62-475(-)